ncbi:MAG: CDP-alcohol phosphatidyltransferase family protein, partial [Acidimicrobiales bacterium]
MEIAVDRKGLDRVFTLPNLISFARLGCVPLFAWLLLGQGQRLAAAGLLAALGATDWVDGYVARRFDQVSTLGKVLDPIADRVVVGVGVLCILIDGSAPVWFGVAVLVREALLSIVVAVLAALGAARID